MPTTMMQALADEAKSLTTDVDMLARQADDLRTRLFQLADMIVTLSLDEARAPASITATAEEFQQFQARYFPFNAVSDRPAPGIQPQTQDDRQVTHGSDEVAPGGGDREAQSEQVVTEAVSEERVAARNDPETAPEAPEDPHARKNRALDLYASEKAGLKHLCTKVPCAYSTFQDYLRQARRDGDKRVATGDLLRTPAEDTSITPPADVAKEEPPEVDLSEPAKPGEICKINLDSCVVTHRNRSLQLARHEMRILLALNSGAPITLEDMLSAAGVITGRRVDSEVTKLNPRIAQIGLNIEKLPTHEYELLPIKV